LRRRRSDFVRIDGGRDAVGRFRGEDELGLLRFDARRRFKRERTAKANDVALRGFRLAAGEQSLDLPFP
jgi:hypothetical protein